MKGRVTPHEKAMIAFYKGQGLSHREIGRKLGRSHKAVDDYIHQIFPRDAFAMPEVKEDPFECLIEQFVLAQTLADRFISCRRLSRMIQDKFQRPCSKTKVSRIRKDLGLIQTWAKKTEKLDPRHINLRFAFAQEIQKRPCFQLPWIISDESCFVLCHQRRKLYRFRGENSESIFQEFAGYPIKCMVWGAIGPNFKSQLIRFDGTVDANSYIAAMERSGIFEYLHAQFPDGFIYQQDGARPHTAAYTLEYLRRKITEQCLLPRDCNWPPSSPDLSPIEEIWGYMKSQLNISDVKTKDQLFSAVERLWNEIPMDTINNFMKSLKPRIFVLEDLRGRSLAGHKDMVRCYQDFGLDGRSHALELKDRHSIPENYLREVQELLDKLIDALAQDLTFREKNTVIRDFNLQAQVRNQSLPR
jgi:transposase